MKYFLFIFSCKFICMRNLQHKFAPVVSLNCFMAVSFLYYVTLLLHVCAHLAMGNFKHMKHFLFIYLCKFICLHNLLHKSVPLVSSKCFMNILFLYYLTLMLHVPFHLWMGVFLSSATVINVFEILL